MRIRPWQITLISCALSAIFLDHSLAQQTLPSFEVASVKPADPKLGFQLIPVRGGLGSPDPSQVAYSNVSLKYMLYYAYGTRSDQIVGPAWIGSEHYDIVAKIPPGTTMEQFTLMLRNLLADRFHLVLHHEAKAVRAYQLTIGRNGPRLRKSSEADSLVAEQPRSDFPLSAKPAVDGYPRLDGPGMIYPYVLGSNGQAIHLIARAQKLSDLATVLAGNFGHPILDKTDLTGRYDFTLEFAPETTTPTTPSPELTSDAQGGALPKLPEALQEQLGLRLEPTTVSVDMLVVDHVDKVPTDN